MTSAQIALGVFILCYLFFVIMPNQRPWVAGIGGALLVFTRALSWKEAFLTVNWNVIGLFVGTLVLAELFLQSRVPAVMAEWLVDKCRSTRAALLSLCIFSGAISIFVENVAVVLLVAPIALSLAQRLKINPTPLLVGIAVSSNLQGTATLIGDPPSMILAGYMRMGFWDFFIYHGRLSIFFAVQTGMLASLLVLVYQFRKYVDTPELIKQGKPRSWTPSVLLLVLITGLSFATLLDPEFSWFAGSLTLVMAGLAVIWSSKIVKWGSAAKLIRELDWGTTLFLIGVFVIVGGLSESGWMERLADLMSCNSNCTPLKAFVLLVALATIISGFVDNIPFLVVMIPVVQDVAAKLQIEVPLLMFGLLIGACLGGNLTPLGASANIVTIGILRKQGFDASFRSFMRVSIPFTIAAVTSACLLVWWVWRPNG